MASSLPRRHEIRILIEAVQKARRELGSLAYLEGCIVREDVTWQTSAQWARLAAFGSASERMMRTMVTYWKGPSFLPLKETFARAARAVAVIEWQWKRDPDPECCGRQILGASMCADWLELIEAVGLFLIDVGAFMASKDTLE